MKKLDGLYLIILAAAIVLQISLGDIPADFFAFPVNAAILAALACALAVLYREKPSLAFARWLASGRTSILMLSTLALACIILGLVTQRPEDSFAGLRNIKATWWFVDILLWLIANLIAVLLTRKFRLRFFLNHAGLALALSGMMLGSPDESSEAVAVYRADTGSGMTMTSFKAEYSLNGMPSDYEARLRIDGRDVTIKVNHPYARTVFDDVYLVDYDRSRPEPAYCIVETVHQPWKSVIWLGIVMMMLGAVLLFAQGVSPHKEKEERI